VSCGGGGAASKPIDSGTFAVNPPTATWYAGVKNTLQFAGGKPPFRLTSSEPGLMPLPDVVNGLSLDVVPNQPGVVDAGLAPGELQVRTVNVVARSAEGFTATAVIKVAENFLTGYSVFTTSTTCSAAEICAGGESTIVFDSTFNGIRYAGHQFRIEKVRGPFQFVDPLNTNNQADAVTVTSDERGLFTTVIRVATGIPAQVALIKITDIPTGAYTFRSLVISTLPATGTLTLIPDTINLTGVDDTICGSGTSDVLVFDGIRPYSIICPDPRIGLPNGSSSTSNTEPGRFTINVGASTPGNCLTNVQCVISDNTGARALLTINTTVGPAKTPTPPVTATPATLTLACNSSGAVTAAGGVGPPYSATSNHPRVTVLTSSNIVTITRLNGDGATVFPTTAIVTVTDGTSAAPVTVTVPANCP